MKEIKRQKNWNGLIFYFYLFYHSLFLQKNVKKYDLIKREAKSSFSKTL